jgi:hypothetical protein
MTLYENGAVVAQTTTTIRPFGTLDPTQQPGVGIGNSGHTDVTRDLPPLARPPFQANRQKRVPQMEQR